MKKIVDASIVQDEELEAFLRADPQNIAVLTDYLAMESFKGNPGKNIRRSLQILNKHRNQIIILKGTGRIVKLRPKEKGLQKRFIDLPQTKSFGKYCDALYQKKEDIRKFTEDIKRKARISKDHFSNLVNDTVTSRVRIEKIKDSYPEKDLKTLRSGKEISDSLCERFIKDILHITRILYNESHSSEELPEFQDIIFSFQFRYSLASYMLTVKWITDGGYHSIPDWRLISDFTDMIYVAYATYYDGLLSRDKKMIEIYLLSKMILTDSILTKTSS